MLVGRAESRLMTAISPPFMRIDSVPIVPPGDAIAIGLAGRRNLVSFCGDSSGGLLPAAAPPICPPSFTVLSKLLPQVFPRYFMT